MMLLLKVTMLFATGWVAALFLARKSAAARHFVWALTLTGALALALASRLAPNLPVRLAAWPAPASEWAGLTRSSTRVSESSLPRPAAVIGEPEVSSRPVVTERTIRLPDGWSIGRLLSALWLLGAALIVGWYGVGHLRLAHLARGAIPIDNPEWHASLRAMAERAGVSAPVRLLRTSAVGSPITWACAGR